MSEMQDIFLRAHTVVVSPRKSKKGKGKRRGRRPRRNLRKWPDYAVVFDCETRIDTGQGLTFGFYRVLKLQGATYLLEEEGAFFDDNLPAHEGKVLEGYVSTAETEVKSFPPQFPLYPRSQFVKQVFYRYARKGALILGFNLCFDLTRLARSCPEGKENEWSLVLVQYKDGNENLHFPRVLIDPIDSKKSFIGFRKEWIPKDKKGRPKAKPTKINESRLLDRSFFHSRDKVYLALARLVVAHLIEQLRHNLEFRFSHTNDQRSSLKKSPMPTSHVNDMHSLFAFYRILAFTQTQLNLWIRHRDR